MNSILQDLQFALRQLRRAPGFTATAVVTLALGLGATSAMLAIVDSVLLRPLALPHPERVMDINRLVDGARSDGIRFKDAAALTRASSLEAVAAYSNLPVPVTTADGTRVVHGTRTGFDFFRIAGAHARLGRVLTQADAHAPVAVVSDAFWRVALHADPRALGTTVRLGSRPVTIVGVMPPGFAFPAYDRGEVLFMPFDMDAHGKDEHGFDYVSVAVGVKPGVARSAALAEAQAIYAHTAPAEDKNRGRLVWRPYQETITGDERPGLLVLLGACGLLLAIACVNAANLQIARAVTRAGEMQVRGALGASRGRLLQQIVTESFTVAGIGAALGLVLAWAALRWASAAYGEDFPRFDEISLHPSVFAACALLALGSGVLAAVAPALGALRRGATGASAERVTHRSRLSGALVAVQIGLTCVLLTAAGLLLRTFRALEQAPLGFDPHHVTEMTLMPTNPAMDGAALEQTYTRLLDRLSALPGVEAAATETSLPFSNFTLELTDSFRIAGRPTKPDDSTSFGLINAGYNRTLGVRMLEGRGFSPSDSAGSQPVCVVNEAFVRKFLNGRRALGAQVEFTNDARDGADDRPIRAPLTIVGVMPEVLGVSGGSLADRPGPLLLLNYQQYPPGGMRAHFLMGLAPQFAVRSPLPVATLREEIRTALRQSAPEMAEMQIRPVEESLALSLAGQKLALRMASGFGLAALALAAIGIYGVLAYSVARRTREIGIRMALGSSRGRAMRLVMGQAGVMVALGLLVGAAATWPATRTLRAYLFGVTRMDPLTLLTVTLVLLAAGTLAAAVPAWRAARVDPMTALRRE